MAYSCPEYPCPKPSQDVRRVLHLLHCILEHQRMAKRRLLNVVHVYVSCEENWTDLSEPTTFKSQQQKELNSEVQNIKVDIKASFEETVGALDTFMNYLEAPSEETSEKLKQLCDREKSTGNELLTTREIDETFDVSRSFLIDETRKCQDSNHESFSSEKHSVLELSPPVNSVSREASEKDLEKDCENYFQHNSNEKQHRRENLLQILTTYDNDHDDSIVGYESVGNFENCQERRIKAMENEIHLLRAENREILMELGQITVEKTARENERRKSELFYRVYCSSSSNFVSTSNDKLTTEDEALGHPNNDDNTLQKSPYVNKNPSTSKASGNGFTKPQATNTNADPTSLVSKAISSKRNVQGAESLVKENDHHPGKEEIVTNDKDKRNLHDGGQNGSGILTHNNENENLRTEDLPNIASKKKTSGGEGIDQSGNVTGRSDAASTSRKGSNEQSLNQQSYESLSFSVQQDYSNEKEKISLSNVPPTSVATTLYNNYKLLLLSLGQMLLSNDVTKLMAWATQNFPIVNPQNATHVLFQLDENEVINASDLSQLRHFFESIVRFDLVYVIDTFLLGDYNILRQITASKKRDVNTPQTSQTGTTTRYQNLFNAASNSQFSLRDSSLRAENSNEPQSSVLQQKQQAFPTLVLSNPTPNDAKFVPRSPNENTSSAYGLQSLKSVATGFTASQQVVVDGHVTSKLHYCFVRHDIHEKEISYQVAINAKKDYYILQAKNLVNAYVLFNYLFYVFIDVKYFSPLVL